MYRFDSFVFQACPEKGLTFHYFLDLIYSKGKKIKLGNPY